MEGYETLSRPVNTTLRIHSLTAAQPPHQDINVTPLCIDLVSSSAESDSESDTPNSAEWTLPISGSHPSAHREGRGRSHAHSTPRSSPSPIPQSISDSCSSSNSSISSSEENTSVNNSILSP
nr:uncharacterized protein LOC123751521 [Procambarus clarkii]